ncbi:hypothetical protein AB0M43_13810 [Longispora sp. NPDC051575]|uniref:hypothetical protein n=1 Tax=Longispora sp. NPDC051575 TaxID=3154943 RepID=UPI003431188E
MPVWLATTLPVVTLVLGAVLSHLAERSRDARQRSAARAVREADREQERLRRRESFELEHLTDLHVALTALLRATSRIHHANALALRQAGAYAGDLLPEDISDEQFEAHRKIVALKELALDRRIRDLVDEAHLQATAVAALVGGTVDAGARLVRLTGDAVVEAQTAIALRIREIYVDGG